MWALRAPLAVLAVALLAGSGAAQSDEGLWEREPLTTSGSLRGHVKDTAHGPVAQFLGVRYAEVPRRFAPPQPHRVADRGRVVDALSFAPACQQPPHLADLMYPALVRPAGEWAVSEDCLFLNVFAPAAPPAAGPRAVMVWLPGEGFGFADAAQFDASALAARGDVIVVTVNYRVGVFGFLSTGNASVPGNAGLADVLEALRWVRANAAAFGGDVARVTLFGRFTGSMLASLALVSPALVERAPGAGGEPQPLVARVVLQSGVAAGAYALDPAPANRTAALAQNLGCRGSHDQVLACLRAAPAERLAHLTGEEAHWRPVVDGALVPAEPLRAVRKASYNRNIDVLIGETGHEGSLCVLHHYYLETVFAAQILSNNITKKEFSQLIKEHLNDYFKFQEQPLVDAVAHEYKLWPDTGKSYRSQFLKFCGALYVRVKNEQLARALVKRNSRVWRYEFAHRPSSSHHPPFLGAAHGDDVLFVFALLDEQKSTPEELKLAAQMVTAWTNFAKTGNPNQEGENKWPQFLDNSRQMRIFSLSGTESKSTDFLSQDADFWGSVVPGLIRSSQRTQTQNRVCAKQQKAGGPRTCNTSCPAVTGLIVLSIILAIALLLIAFYLLQLTRGGIKGLLSQEHVSQ